MNPIIRKFLFSLGICTVFFGSIEIYLRHIAYQGTSISDLLDTAGFPQNSYVHKRDRILGSWYLETPNGYRANPDLRVRGFHNEIFLKSESRIFSMGGSTTYGSPFEHEEKGFSERLEKKLTTNIRIINAGVAGMDSSAFPEMGKEFAKISGLGAIIYTGNNEIRGSLLRLCSNKYTSIFSNFKIYTLLQDTYREVSGFQYTYQYIKEHQEDCISRGVHMTLAQAIEPSSKLRQDTIYRQTLHSFSQNLSRTIEQFQQVDMHVWLIIPPINVYSPPTFSHAHPSLPKAIQNQILEREQLKDWSGILSLDPTHARANYEIGRKEKNITLLRTAAEYDYATRRITPSVQNQLVELCKKYHKDVSCIDMRHIEEHDTNRFFVDFCHPTLDFGVEYIAQSLLPYIK